MDPKRGSADDQAAIRGIIEDWAEAVRRRDYPAILQYHSSDIVMFDVPPPFKSEGMEAYKQTWDRFFSWTDRPIPFDFIDLTITADKRVAFAFATLNCAEPGLDGEPRPLKFRLTIGLRKIDDRWTITHEHHSVPAAD